MHYISTITTSGTSTTLIDFQNIPSSYDHLVVYASMRNAGGNFGGYTMFFNGSTTSDVFAQIGIGATNTTLETIARNDNIDLQLFPIASPDAGDSYTSSRFFIPNYKDTSRKMAIGEGSGRFHTRRHRYALIRTSSTSAITSLQIGNGSADTLAHNCTATLYGMKNTK